MSHFLSSNISVLKQSHTGLSAARNLGLAHALGKYVYFVDSDDRIALGMFKKAWELCESNELDVLFFSFVNIADDETIKSDYAKHFATKKRTHSFEQVVSGMEMHNLLWSVKEYYPMVWIQLVRREFLIKNKIKFDEGIIYEDNLYTFILLLNAKKVMCINDIWYFKRIHRNSITTQKESVLSVYSFLHTLIKMKDTLHIDAQTSILDAYYAGIIQKSIAIMLFDISSTLSRRFHRLDADNKKQLYERCNSREKSMMDTIEKKASTNDF